jgi:tetratricopeptide (TPR) repeat protein
VTFEAAVALHRSGDLAAAEAAYAEIVAADPGHWDAIQLLGVLAAQTRRIELAAERFAQAIALNPDHPVLRHNLARIRIEQERYAEALALCDEAIARQADFAAAHESRVVALLKLERYAEAYAAGERLITLAPGVLAGHLGQATAATQLCRPLEAKAAYERALAIRPNDPDVNLHYALTLLKLGDLGAGFRHFEHRLGAAGAARVHTGGRPLWLGGPGPKPRSLLVPGEFFLGDTLHFARYARVAEAAGMRVSLAAPARLHRLLRSLGPTVRIVGEDEAPADCDAYCPLMSLPLAFGTTLETVPADVPYLRAEPERVAAWTDRVGSGGFRIGVCWEGSRRDRVPSGPREFPPAALTPLARLRGVRLISLQGPEGAGAPPGLTPDLPIETLAGLDAGPDAFVDTAAVMQTLDLVISCDTAVAHLAGALGRPVWVALPYDAEWRWLLDRADSPWYPTLRLFRQPEPGDWTAVFAAMRDALAETLA